MKTLLLLIVGFITSCAMTLTTEESAVCEGNSTCLQEALDQKIAQKRHESEDLRILKREKLVEFVLGCKSSGMVITRRLHAGGQMHKPLFDRRGNMKLPRNAHALDYGCITREQAAAVYRG